MQESEKQNKFKHKEQELLQSLQRKNLKVEELHFIYLDLIKLYWLDRKRRTSLYNCIKYCNEDIKLFPKFKRAMIRQDGGFYIDSVPSFNTLWKISFILGEFEVSKEVCKKAIENNWDVDIWEYLLGQVPHLESIADYIKKNPGVVQKDIYKLFPDADKKVVREFLYYAKENFIIREEKGSTYQLFIE